MNLDRDPIHIMLSLTVTAQENEQYICRVTSSLGEQTGDTKTFRGQNQNHAIAIALEKLAADYRQAAEEEQQIEWDAIECSEAGTPVQNYYHVVLHYETIAEDESKFYAMHNTIMGNTVVENATITIVQVEPDFAINRGV